MSSEHQNRNVPITRTFRLEGSGLTRVFGRLEAKIMETMWTRGKFMSVQDVCDAITPAGNYKTVMTVLTRLTDKGMLQRRKEGRAYLYHPVVNRSTFLESVADQVTQGLLQEYGEVAVSSFVHALESASPESLAKLEQLIEDRKNARDTGDL